MKNKNILFLAVVSIPIAYAMTQVVKRDTPVKLLIVLGVLSIVLSIKPVKYFSDVIFYLFFEICLFLGALIYSSRILNYLFTHDNIADKFAYQSIGPNWVFLTSAVLALVESMILITFYHQHKDGEKRTFELFFSIVMTNILLFVILS